jgi:hypothetical protein
MNVVLQLARLAASMKSVYTIVFTGMMLAELVKHGWRRRNDRR